MNNAEEQSYWTKLISSKRISELIGGTEPKNNDNDPRNPFERDCDRIIFSYPFRRLQDKTQVIPFPIYDFVHTRLTHTIEVSSVGRSLGQLLESYLINERKINVVKGEIPAIVQAACLAHDIGNPPFGHSGEKAISDAFKNSEKIRKRYLDKEGKLDEAIISTEKLKDLTEFEGNANGFSNLT